MARTVTDAAVLLGALTGIDPRDAATANSRGRLQTDYTKFLDPRGLANARIGIARNYFGFSDRVDKLINEAIDVMKRLGATVIDTELPNKGKYEDAEFEVLLYEFKADMKAYLATRGATVPVKSLDDIIAFNEANRDRELQHFNQDTMRKAAGKGDLNSPAYQRALAKCQRLTRAEGIDAALTKHKLDALVAPTDGIPWMTDFLNGDHFSGGCSTPPAVSGYPHVTVPAGYIQGLPVGVSFFGAAWSEGKLLQFAYAFEQVTQHRRAPQFLARVNL